MLECPNCRQTYRDGTRFCGACGAPLVGTVPAVVSSNLSPKEPLVSGQGTPGFQARDILEDTLLRKMPDGFSWQASRTIFVDTEPQSASGLVSEDENEVTMMFTRPPLWPADSSEPVTPVTLALSVAQAGQAQQTIHETPGAAGSGPLMAKDSTLPAHPVAPVAAGLPDGVAAPSVASRSANAPGEHLAFAIPARPGRMAGNLSSAGQVFQASDELAHSASSACGQTLEEPGLSAEAMPEDGGVLAPDEFQTALNVHISGAPALPAVPDTRPFSETSISSDLFAALIARTLPAATPGAPVLAPEMTDPTFFIAAGEIVNSLVPSTPASHELVEETERVMPATPGALEEPGIAVAAALEVAEVQDELAEKARLEPAAFFAPFYKPTEVPAHLLRPGDPHWHLKQELIAQRVEITAAMDELLPLVYDNHRRENQALFAGILTHHPPLEDEAWGHAAFVLGAYGNYMYRNQLSFAKKLEIWRAQLWAVYYERSYRRKYLAQRCQQLVHYFQGCAENPIFFVITLHDLETLYLYLEPGSLRKMQQMLQTLPEPPEELLQHIEEQMVIAEQEKTERMARQPLPTQQKKAPAFVHKPALPAGQNHEGRPVARPVSGSGQRGGSVPAVTQLFPPAQGYRTPALAPGGNAPQGARAPGQSGAQEQIAFALPPETRKLLSFWSEEQCRQFFASLRTDRLEMINQLLLQARNQILMAARAELLTATDLVYQRPRKSVLIHLESRNSSNHDQFGHAFRLLSSPKLKDQQAALRIFEQNLRENIQQENEQISREWMFYARALTQGSTRVAPDWERDLKKGEASWEEVWNLACYHYLASDLIETARVLAPGLHQLEAPLSHLRLALICALTLLLETAPNEPGVLQNARELLLRHLECWPHPLGCLAWLALSYDLPGTLRTLDRSRRLSTFQELLDAPVDLPDPRAELAEAQLNALENALVHKTHCEEAWFLWLNDYAARRPHNFPAWQRLAETSERMGHLERAELAFQHIAGIYYDLDYVYTQEGEEGVQAAEELRSHVEHLFEFYRRHQLQSQAWDSFESCFVTLNQLGFWDEQKPANQRLLTLVQPFLLEYQRREAQRHEAHLLADLQNAKERSVIRRSEWSNNPTRPLEHFKSGQRVGIFVDYENIARFIPHAEDMEHIGQILVSYAAQFGDVVSRWASASPRNLPNLTAVRTGLEAAQFKVRYPRRELQFSASQKDLADYALLECISTASLNDHLDVYLVVSGDRDYYERIYSLLESGRTVHILASDGNLSNSYRELEQQRQRKHKAAGHEETDFFIDDLDEVLRPASLSQPW